MMCLVWGLLANNIGDTVDLTTPDVRKHILEGDKRGGGHRAGTGKPGKSEFPASWSDDKIIYTISDVATDPSSKVASGRYGRTIVSGTREGINIEVVLESLAKGGGIVTGYPTHMPRNP